MAGKHVLIIDDDMEFVKLYSMFLRNKGLEVSAAYGASEAMEAIESANPDLVVLDVMMEILMTAIGEETGLDFRPKNDEERELMHADAFLDKAASPDDLFAKIEQILS